MPEPRKSKHKTSFEGLRKVFSQTLSRLELILCIWIVKVINGLEKAPCVIAHIVFEKFHVVKVRGLVEEKKVNDH